MADFSSPIDDNGVKAIIVTRADDGVFPMNVYIKPLTNRMLVENESQGSIMFTNNAIRDNNAFPVLMGVSSADGKTLIPIGGDINTGAMLVQG